ncbi:hypothetical protein RNJ44_00296 [Nakaseomyces bracarensis]|uniref:Tetratricopeptide SHNi-TPR domain-containing protein n=1 Tax=Nakaseomyces bracarensis TaxID=273131 RepID=A0ABR4NTH1_9SACH
MDRAQEIARQLDESGDDCLLMVELAKVLLEHGIKNSDLFNGMDEEGEEGESGSDDESDDDEGEGEGGEDEERQENMSKYYQFDLEEEEEGEEEDEDDGEVQEDLPFVQYLEGNPFESALAVLQRGEQVGEGEVLIEVYKLMGEVYGELGEDQDSIQCYERAIELLESCFSASGAPERDDTQDYTRQIEILEKLSQNLKLSADISAQEKLEIAKKFKGYLEKQIKNHPETKEINLARLEEVKLDIKEIKLELEMGTDSNNSKELLKNLILNQMAKLNPQFEKKRNNINDLSGMIKKKRK